MKIFLALLFLLQILQYCLHRRQVKRGDLLELKQGWQKKTLDGLVDNDLKQSKRILALSAEIFDNYKSTET